MTTPIDQQVNQTQQILEKLDPNDRQALIAYYKKQREENRYLFFEPCGKAAEFVHRIATEEEKFIWFFCGGNSSSKTTTAINILANVIWGGQNKYFNYPLFKKWPYLKRARFVTKAEILTQKTIPEIEKWFPKGRYTEYARGKNRISEIKTDNDWTVSFMTFDQDPGDFEGVDLGLIMVDEPAPEKIWNTFASRLRDGGGKIINTFTPIGEAAYLHNRYISNKQAQKDGKFGYEFISVYDNTKGIGVRGYLDKKVVDDLISDYDIFNRESRIYGKFSFLSGLIYGDCYNPQIHNLKWEEGCIPDEWMRVEAIDWHPNKEWAVTFMAIAPDNTRYTYDEIWANGSYEHIANLILQKRQGITPKITLIEPLAGTFYQGANEIPIVSLMKASNHLIKPIPGSKERDAGIRLFKELMAIDENGVSKWYIYADRCPRTITELNNYQMKDGAICKEYDDMLENHHRLLIYGIKYREGVRFNRGYERKRPLGKFY